MLPRELLNVTTKRVESGKRKEGRGKREEGRGKRKAC
tara:strand:+ start:1061 stop:1171 length:111 start_codon:yes stop_codon:yes gene_type:complete